MSTDFSFFERTLHEQRVYQCHGPYAAWRYEWITHWKLDELVTGGRTEGEDADFTFAGTHQMRPGNPLGLARVNERFNVTLPLDMDAFYRQWDGGVLLFREMYPLLSVEQMLTVNDHFISLAKWDLSNPWPLIRFCDMGDNNYLAMRLAIDGTWQVNFLSRECPEEDFIANWERDHQGAFLDATFNLWVRRMTDTDGWPIGGEVVLYKDDGIPPMERIKKS